MSNVAKQAALKALWDRGELDCSLRSYQLDINSVVEERGKVVCLAHRRLGKTKLGVTRVFSKALKNANTTQVFIGQTSKAQSGLVVPLVNDLVNLFKPTNIPKFNSHKGSYELDNKSRVLFVGAERDQIDRLRGYRIDGIVWDEFGFHPELEYARKSVVGPSVRESGGWELYISTPSVSTAHYANELWREALDGGWSYKLTLDDNPYLSQEFKDACAKDCGGRETNQFMREYLCEWVTDENFAVIPELIREKSPTEKFEHPNTDDPRAEDYDPNPDYLVGLHYDPAGPTVAVLTYFNRKDNYLHVFDSIQLQRPNIHNTAVAVQNLLEKHKLGHDTLVCSELGDEMTVQFLREGLRVAPVGIEDLHATVARTRGLVSKQGKSALKLHDPRVFVHFNSAVFTQDRKRIDESGDGGRFNFLYAVFYILTLRPDVGDSPQSAADMFAAFGGA